jgi:hypothetical protein
MEAKAVKFKFSLSYIVIGIIGILIFGVIIFYTMHIYNLEIKIVDVMSYLTGSVAILTLIYYSLSLESTIHFHNENLLLSKHQYSYDIVSKITEQKMAESIQILNEIKETKFEQLQEKNIKEFLKFLKENPKKRIKLVLILNYFEHISLLIENKHVEEDIIKSSFKTLFTSTYSLFKFYIDERQLEHRRSWIKFEEVSTRWSKEK